MDDKEKMGLLIAKVEAAHGRIDRLESGIRDDLREIQRELKDLTAHMNKGRGMLAVMLFLSGSAGAGVVKLLSMIGPK